MAKELDRFEENPRKNVSLKVKLIAMIVGASILGVVLTGVISLKIFDDGLIRNAENDIHNTAKGVNYILEDWLDNLYRYANMLSMEPSSRSFFSVPRHILPNIVPDISIQGNPNADKIKDMHLWYLTGYVRLAVHTTRRRSLPRRHNLFQLKQQDGVRAHSFSFVVHEEVLPVTRRDDLRQLPDAVRLVLLVLIDLVDMRRHEPDVLHELRGILEHIRVDSLDDRPRLRKDCTVDGQIRVVDIASSHRLDVKQPSINGKLFGDECTFHRVYFTIP